MNTRRSIAVALTLAVSGLASSGVAFAAPAPGAPDASIKADPPWLSQRTADRSIQTATAKPSGPSPWRSALAVLVVAGVGAGALIARRRRRSTAVDPASTVVHVLSAARIGPKAQAVVIEVAGRNLLLGVTESTVTSLGWLDNLTVPGTSTEDGENPEALGAGDDLALPRGREHSTAKPHDARFRDAFDRALGAEGIGESFVGNPSVAALIAARTEDVVSARKTTRRMGSQIDTSGLETQVAGLVRRRGKR